MSAERLEDVRLGQRVTVRHRLPDGRATDSVGTLSARDATGVTLDTRRGEVRVPLSRVVAHRVVRPAPWRVATFLRRAGVAVLDLDVVLRDVDPAGAPVGAVTLVDELVGAGMPVFLLGDGSDGVAEQLRHLGLGRLGPSLLSTGDPGVVRPAPRAFAIAHARIEERLGRPVGLDQVRYTDDRPVNVAAAREHGWQARVFTPPQ